MSPGEPLLFIVGTPIGNLGDLSPRARQALEAADLIAAEDTRRTLGLLSAFGLRKPLVSFHEHNEARRTEELLAALREGRKVALVTDAGMPGVSDPGRRLISAALDAGVPLTVIPGPSAVTTAIVGSGFSGDAFHFGGFLPVKSGGRAREIESALGRAVPSVYFESPHRLAKTLAEIARLDPARPVCVCRELTKIHEEFRRGPAADLLAHYEAHPPKGEIALVIAPAS